MLSKLNEEAYPMRPKSLSAKPLEEGIWFYPGEDAHAIMRAVSEPSGRLVRDAATDLYKVTVRLGAPEDDSRETETMIEVTLAMPSDAVTGTLNMKIVASTLHGDLDLPFITLFEDEISTLAEFDEALENVTPAVVALTW